jgi:hypothetical protein
MQHFSRLHKETRHAHTRRPQSPARGPYTHTLNHTERNAAAARGTQGDKNDGKLTTTHKPSKAAAPRNHTAGAASIQASLARDNARSTNSAHNTNTPRAKCRGKEVSKRARAHKITRPSSDVNDLGVALGAAAGGHKP